MWDVFSFFARGGSLCLAEPAVPVEKTERCLSPAVPAFKTSPGNADDLWSRLMGSGSTVMNLGTRGSTAQTMNLAVVNSGGAAWPLAMRVRQYRILSSHAACTRVLDTHSAVRPRNQVCVPGESSLLGIPRARRPERSERTGHRLSLPQGRSAPRDRRGRQ